MHAFLITAYRDPVLLKMLIDSLSHKLVNVYVHIDRKCLYLFKDLINDYVYVENVHFIPSIRVSWGGVSHFKSIMNLLCFAYKDERNLFFHLISGQDVLTRPLSELFDFFQDNHDSNYLEVTPFRPEWSDRYVLYNMHDVFPVKRNKIYYKIVVLINSLQELIGIKRPDFTFPLYCGSTWWSLNREGANILINAFTKLKGRLQYTFCAEEFFPHSILMNSSIKDQVVNDNLRFILWTTNHTGPDTLNINHYTDIVESKSFFGRKIEADTSLELLKKLNVM